MYSNAFEMLFDFPTKTSTNAANRALVSSCVGGGFILTHGGGAFLCLADRRLPGWLMTAALLLVGNATAEKGTARSATA
jgi:hypothetical protein